MSETIKHYSDINEMFRRINLPLMRHPLFHIVKFENHKFNKNKSSIYTHDYFEIAFSFGYDVNVSVGQQTHNALSHNLIFIAPGQIIKWDGNNTWEGQSKGYILLFKPDFLPSIKGAFQLYEKFPFFNKNTLPSYSLSAIQTSFLQTYFDKISEEYKKNDANSIEIIRSFLTILLLETKRILDVKFTQKSFNSRATEVTYLFEKKIVETPHKRQSIKYYARQLNVSSVYLSECVKKTSGKTAKAIIDEYAILEIKSLLKHTQNSIAQIASNLGFEDHSNFVKYFKKHTQLSPRAFREET